MRPVFLALSKLFDLAFAPLTWALLLLVLAALLRRRGRTPWLLAATAVVVLVVFSLEPVANVLARAAERGARSTYRPDVVYDAVIVLGGQLDAAASRASGEPELLESVERVLRGFELVRSGRARYVVLSAGLTFPQPGEPSEGDRLAAKLVAWGLPPDRVVVEGRSRNTRENAIETARVVAARGLTKLLLVTSAAHVPRALGCFRAVGVEPDVLPVDHRAGDGLGTTWLPRAHALDASTDALREMFGRMAYALAGYTR